MGGFDEVDDGNSCLPKKETATSAVVVDGTCAFSSGNSRYCTYIGLLLIFTC